MLQKENALLMSEKWMTILNKKKELQTGAPILEKSRREFEKGNMPIKIALL